jgi:hypothetical protein
MARFRYQDGCLLCNQCGRLYETTPPEGSGKFECPCGNAETLDAIHRLMDLYNPATDDRAPESDKTRP